jgi:hypothetical protein
MIFHISTGIKRRIGLARAGLLSSALVAVALGAAACGGSPSAGVASIGTTTTAAPEASSGSGTTAEAARAGSIGADALKFAACMRSHGVKNFPNPVISAHQVSIKIGPAVGVNPKSPMFQSALAHCRALLPEGGPGGGTITPADQVDYLKAAQCMRDHGIVGFPDPIFSHGNVRFVLPAGMNSNAMPFLKARVICEKLIPAGLPYSS